MTIEKMDVDIDNRRSTSRFASWGRLVRLHTAFPTSLIALVAYITTDSVTVIGSISIILIAGIMHTSICTMNDYLDYEDDKEDVEKSIRPLVNDEISLDSAKQYVFISAGASLSIAMLTGFYVFLVSVLGYAAASGYNYYSGDATHADVWYVASILILASLGPVVAGTYTAGTIAIMGVLVIHGFYQVQEGHMKDLGTDEKNIIQWLGVRIVGQRKVMYPDGFIGATYFLKLIEVSLLLFILYLNLDTITGYSSASLGIISIAYVINGLIYLYSLEKWLVDIFKRGDVVKYITLHEVSAVMLIMLTIISYSPRASIFLMIAAPIYLFGTNLFIHNDAVSPDI